MGISPLQFQIMQARVSPFNPPTEPFSVVRDRESKLHEQIIQECKARGWICYHGSMAHRARRTIGEPDFQIYGGGGKFWLIEAKTATGKLSVEQQGMAKWANMLGHKIHVVRNFAEFLEVTHV